MGDSFTRPGVTRRVLCAFCFFGFVGGAVAVCFEGCCGGMCWPRERPATHAAAGAAARGVRGDWGILCGWTGSRCRGHGLTTGVVRHACRLRRDGTRRFLFWGILLRLDWEPLRGHVLAAERPATHAAAGAAARGVRGGLGDSFTCSGATRRVLMRFWFWVAGVVGFH